MAKMKTVKIAPSPTEDESRKQIAEAAYYSFLDRGRYAQPGDEINDWIVAEKEIKGRSLVQA
jgi:hypothetical protein